MGSSRSNRGRARAGWALSGWLLGSLSGVVVLAAPAVARAEWDAADCPEIDAQRLGKDPALLNKRHSFKAKVLAIVGDQIIIRGNDQVPLKLSKAVLDTGWVDGAKEGDNFQAFGYLAPAGRGLVFNVLRLTPRPDDIPLFREEIASLAKLGDAEALYKKGVEIEAEAAATRRERELKPVALEAYRAGIELREKGTAADDAAGWVRLAGDHFKLLGDRQSALERVVKATKPGEPLLAEVKKMLLDLNAHLYGGQYLLYEDMKRREGFVERGGNWVLKERADFEDEVEKRRVRPEKLRKLLQDYYAQVASTGGVELGMTKSEVAKAIGFPDEVDRKRMGADIFDVWSYEGRGAFYFHNGELFKRPDSPR